MKTTTTCGKTESSSERSKEKSNGKPVAFSIPAQRDKIMIQIIAIYA